MKQIISRFNPWWEPGYSFEQLIPREKWTTNIYNQIDLPVVSFLTGIRRIGKTSLMKLTIRHLINQNGVGPDKILYCSVDDYLLAQRNLPEIVDEFRKIHGHRFEEKLYLFFDEITYLAEYEIQLKNLIDNQNVKIFASSSSASLLASKKPYLTGRQRIVEVLPLDYHEYLLFKNLQVSPSDEHLHEVYFKEFLLSGGIPEYVKSGDFQYLKNLVDDIIYKDVAAIHGIKDIQLLIDFFMLAMERAGKQMSLNKMATILSVSVDTARRFMELFQSTFLIYTMSRFGTTNERILAPKKLFAADTGFRSIFVGEKDFGALFENYVFLRIKHQQPQYLYTDQTEIDFIFKNLKILAEAKYHDQGLSAKQQKLFDQFPDYSKFIITSENDIDILLSAIKSRSA